MATIPTPPSAPPLPSEPLGGLPKGVEQLVLVAAVARDGAIGRRGTLPWHLPEDLRHFRRLTEGHVLLMGRRTWTSLGGPLPRRAHVVLSRSPHAINLPPEVHAATSLREALESAAALGDPAPRVIGGAEVYRLALPLVTELWITRVALSVPDADTFFPEPPPETFVLVETRRGTDPRITFQRLLRRS